MANPPRGSVSASEFWTSASVAQDVSSISQRVGALEDAVDVIHKRIDTQQARQDTHRARMLSIVLAVAIPISGILWAVWSAADDGQEIAAQVSIETKRLASDVDALQVTQAEIREGVVEIRTGQMHLRDEVRNNQSVLLDQLREINAR